jgi:hypothetical protein
MKGLQIKKRYKIILGIILFIAVILFAFPRIARMYIVKNSPELLGRRLTVDKIRFNYFTGTLSIRNLQLFEADSKTLFISTKGLKVDLDYLPLLRNEILVKYIILDDPNVQVIQNGDLFNFSDLMNGDSLVAEADTVPSKPLKYIINNISINAGFVKYTDQILNHTISMNRVDLNIPGFTWNSDSTKLGVDFRFTDGGRLYSNLELSQADSTYLVNLRLDSLNLDIIEPYVKNAMYISALHGYLSNDIHIRGDMRSIMKLSVEGTNHIFDFQLIDTLQRAVLAFDDFTLDIDTLLLETNTVRVNSIELTRPFILYERIDSLNNWLALMKPSGEQTDTTAQDADSSADETGSPFAFSTLKISGGSIKLTDNSIRYPFDFTIDNIDVASTPDTRMPGRKNVSMSAGLNGTGKFVLKALLNPDDLNDLEVSVSINQFRMKDVEPYFRHYFGFPVTGGRMNFSSDNKLKNQSLVSNNSLYFRKFTLEKKSDEKTEYNIPLRLALGVMSDKDGIIDLKSPVEMKGEDVKVGNLRKIIFRAIGNLFVKAAVSPVNMIADLFKTDAETLKKIGLLLNDPSPDRKNLETLDILADILNKKPGLNLDFVYCIDRQRVSDTLAHILALEDYARSNNIMEGTAEIPDSTLSRYIAGKLGADSLQAKSALNELCRNYIGSEKLNSRIDSLKNSQTVFLQNYLSHDKEIPADRFRIIGTMPDSIRYEEPVPSFRTYFTAGDPD